MRLALIVCKKLCLIVIRTCRKKKQSTEWRLRLQIFEWDLKLVKFIKFENNKIIGG